jgi:hypothetical protein
MGEMRQGISAELMLLNWNESANSGCKLIFEIAPDELEPFKNLKTRAGKKVAGQRFAAVLVLIDDDESVVPPQAAPVPATPQEAKAQMNDSAALASPARRGGFSDAVGQRARLAVQWCDTERFASWIAEQCGHTSDETPSAALAKKIVCEVCGINSRKELDTNEAAWTAFENFIREPYMEYLQTEGVGA